MNYRYSLAAVVILLLLALAAPPAAARTHHRSRSAAPRASTSTPAEFLEVPRPATEGDIGFSALRIHAASAILMDGNTGTVLFAHNADDPRPPASVTKILTALVILEQGRLTDTVTVSRTAAGTGGHRLGLRAGQRISLDDLLAAILIRSANDAAVAAAEHVGGSVAGFAELMNAKARALGMVQSHFVNPHGLDESGHVTTARDLARLTRVALAQPQFARLVSARETRVNIWQTGRRHRLVARPRLILSHNRLLGRVAGADGVKTGYTGGAGRCLVGSASRGEHRMIAVLLNDPHRWHDAETLLEYGFQVAAVAPRSAHLAPAFSRPALARVALRPAGEE